MFWQLIYSVFVAGYAIFIFGELVAAIQYGNRLRSAVYVWCASPLPLLFVAVVIERRPLSELSISDLPWSLVFGDSFVVAPAAAVAADAWHKYPPAFEVSSRRVWSLFVGLVAGTAFHVWDVMANYSPTDMLVKWSPTKLLHDFGTFVAIVATLMCVVLPLMLRLSRWKTWHNWMILGCFVSLVGLVAVDGGRKLSAQTIHVPWDPSSSWGELLRACTELF